MKDERNDVDNSEILLKQIESARKKHKILKILILFLSLFICGLVVISLNFYGGYKKLEKSFTSFSKEDDSLNTEMLDKMMKEAYKINDNYSSYSTFTSLSLINFSTEMAATLKDEKTRQDVEELVKEYTENEEVKKFFEKLKQDKDFKEILEAPDEEKPIKLFKKMQDPKFMNKYMKILLSDPSFLKMMIKTMSDPRIHSLTKDLPSDMNLINASTATE